MTNFSDDSDAESNCDESYNNTFKGGEDMRLNDNATTHVILRDKCFFVNFESSHAPNSIETVVGVVSIARCWSCMLDNAEWFPH